MRNRMSKLHMTEWIDRLLACRSSEVLTRVRECVLLRNPVNAVKKKFTAKPPNLTKSHGFQLIHGLKGGGFVKNISFSPLFTANYTIFSKKTGFLTKCQKCYKNGLLGLR